MNKWSLLLFSVLGLLLSTTSELNFVDGRLGCSARASRALLSDTRLSIYEPQSAYDTCTEATQLISQKRDICYARNVELKRSRSDRRREQSEGRRISSDERFRVLRNVDFEGSILSNDRVKKDSREINDLQLRRNLKSRDYFNENHVDRSRSHNDNFRGNQMKRNLREREMNIEEELTEIWDKRFRHNERSVRANLKDHRQERFNRRTFVIRTNNMPSENFGTRLLFIQKNKAKRDMERGKPDINTRPRLFEDNHLTSELSRNSDGRFRRDDARIQFTSKIGILRRNGNIRDYRDLSVRDDSIEKMYEKENLNAVRRNTNMEHTLNVYRRSYDENHSEDMFEEINKNNLVIRVKNERFTRLDKRLSRPKMIQRENEGSGNRMPEDKRQKNNGFQKSLFEKRFSTQRLPRQISNINRLRQARFYNDINIRDKQYNSNVFIESIERPFEQSRNRRIRENNREIRTIKEYMDERITPQYKNNLVEKRAASSNINIRRSEAIRRSVLERLDIENSRYSLDLENENNFDQRRIRQIRNRNNENLLRKARNTQRKTIHNTAMGQEINNIRQNYDEDNVSQRFIVTLSRTDKRASQITIIQRENRIKMHIRAINLQENRMQDHPNFNRLVFNTNRNVAKRRTRTLKQANKNFVLVREAERAFDESRIRQVRDKRDNGGEYRLNVERTVQRDLTRIGRNNNNVLESSLVSTISNISKNRLYRRIRSDIAMLRRRENYEAIDSLGYENERIFDQRTTRNVLERREENIRNERKTARNSPHKDSMKYAMLNNNRRSYNDEINSQVMLARTNQREMINRSERERSFSVNKRSSYLGVIQREHENRMNNEYRQPMKIEEHRLRRERCGMRCLAEQDFDLNRFVEDRRTGTPNEKFNARDLVLETIPSEESRIRQQRSGPKNRLNEKLTAERVLVRNNNKVIEKRESRIRPHYVNQNQNTKRSLILLQLREKDVISLMRLNERDNEHNRRIRNRRELSRIEDHSRYTRIAEERGLRNERSNTRITRQKVIPRYIETEVEFRDSDKTRHERRTERIIRNIARHGVSIKNRHLLEARSEKQRELEYIRYERNYNGLENNVHSENKENVRQTSHNNKERAARDRARDIRAFNDVQIPKKETRITKNRRTNEEEREIRTGFSKLRYLPIEYKTQSDSQIFDIKLQYIFYMLQGLYVLGLFTKTINSDGIEKSTRFSNWLPLFSTLKVY